MSRKFLFGLLIGWGVAILLSPRDVLGWMTGRGKTA